MNSKSATQHLLQALSDLRKATERLAFSFDRIAALPSNLEGVAESDLESVEAFCSRFARSVDILVNKTLRALDRVELLPPGTLLDVVHRAEKRGLITDAMILREMKETRNLIAHDYAGAELERIFAYCRESTPLLLQISEQIAHYCSQFFPD